ncbi:MAG: hypothetical protein AAGF84_10060 [Planctomycetota bacterium]
MHDASFDPASVILDGDRLSIPMIRDCWERWPGGNRGGESLLSVQSRLEFSGVTEIVWEPQDPVTRFEITHLWTSEPVFADPFASFDVELFGRVRFRPDEDCSLRVKLSGAEKGRIELIDQEMPKG